jgi:hypothetical protein
VFLKIELQVKMSMLQPPPPEPTRYGFPVKRILVTRDPKDRSVAGKYRYFNFYTVILVLKKLQQ